MLLEGTDFLYVCPKHTDLLFSMIPISISKYRQVSLWTGKFKKKKAVYLVKKTQTEHTHPFMFTASNLAICILTSGGAKSPQKRLLFTSTGDYEQSTQLSKGELPC